MTQTDIERLDQVIDEVAGPQESQCELLREHLENARVYRMGEMPMEYQLNIAMALDVVDCIIDAARRDKVRSALRHLLEESRSGARRG